MNDKALEGKVAVVAGATRGAGRGIACMLGAAGATVYCTGRSSTGNPSPMGRPETIEETGELVVQHGGKAIPVRVDHTVEAEVVALFQRVRADQGRLDILVNDIWGGDPMIDWSARFWDIDMTAARALIDQAVFSHMLNARHAAPLMIEGGSGLIVEITDGTFAGYRGQMLYDLVKSAVIRLGYAMAWDLVGTGVTALTVSPGFLRSEAVLAHFGVTEANWRDAVAKDPFFAESETPFLVGRGVAALAADPDVGRRAGTALYAGELARAYGFTDVDGGLPDFFALLDRAVGAIVAREAPLEGDERFLVRARYLQIHRDPGQREAAARLAERLGLTGEGAGLQPL